MPKESGIWTYLKDKKKNPNDGFWKDALKRNNFKVSAIRRRIKPVHAGNIWISVKQNHLQQRLEDKQKPTAEYEAPG